MTHDRQQIQQLAREYTEAWCSRDPRRVAAHYAADGTIAINGGEPAPIEGVAESFVAMPFQERFSYRSREILSRVIGAAVDEANRYTKTARQFEVPERIDVPMGAAVITEEIVLRILESHIFLADVTFENAGVLLGAC